jgi:hypothetical protein
MFSLALSRLGQKEKNKEQGKKERKTDLLRAVERRKKRSSSSSQSPIAIYRVEPLSRSPRPAYNELSTIASAGGVAIFKAAKFSSFPDATGPESFWITRFCAAEQ